MKISSRAKGILAITCSAFGFAVMATCVRLADDFGAPISSIQKSFFRNVVALAIALAVLVRTERGSSAKSTPANARAWLVLVTRSVLGTLGIFANFYALSNIPIAVGQTLNKTAPFFTVVFAWLFLGERMRMRDTISLAVAFVGVLFIAKPGFAGAETIPLLAGLFGGMAAGGAYACVRALRTHAVGSAVIVVFFSAFSCLSSVPFMLARFDPMTLAQVLVLVGAGAGAAIGQFGVTAAYGYAAPREIAVYDYSNILFTALFGFFLFGQVPDVFSLAGILVVILAVLIRA